MDIKQIDKSYVANTYKRFDLLITHGKGELLYDENEKEYIDMGSGIGVTAFGACDPVIKKAVTEQMELVQHTSNLYYTAPCARLAEVLCKKSGLKKVFFGNSGAEANECAIKTARKYSHDRYGDGRNVIVTLVNSFHGRTVTTLAATGQDVFHKDFGPFTQGFRYCRANDCDMLTEMLMQDDVCGLMLEVVQGEGGVMAMDPQFLSLAQKLADERDIILIVDEVQTGNGRTGKYFSYMHYDLHPDIVTTAKGLGGGFPIGACIFGEKTESTLGFSDHGSTYGGNPVCAAAALAVAERIDEAFCAEVQRKGRLVRSMLEGAENIKSVSGLGLMLGIETTKNAGEVAAECMARGVLVLTAKTKVRLLPPLCISDENLKKAVNIILEVIAR